MSTRGRRRALRVLARRKQNSIDRRHEKWRERKKVVRGRKK